MNNKTLFIYFLLLGLFSCDKEELKTNINNIDDEIEVILSQKPTFSAIIPSLEITTVDSVSCSNTELWIESNQNDQLFEIDILGILLNGNCISENFKPMKEVELTANIGKYDLIFDLKNSVKSKGRIEISEHQICLKMSEETGVVAGNQCIQRLDPKAAWGYFQGQNDTDIATFNQFLLSLSYLSFNGSAGNYGIFTLSENKQVSLRQPLFDVQAYPKSQQFYFQVADIDSFIADLDQYLQNKSGFKLELKFYNGLTVKRS